MLEFLPCAMPGKKAASLAAVSPSARIVSERDSIGGKILLISTLLKTCVLSSSRPPQPISGTAIAIANRSFFIFIIQLVGGDYAAGEAGVVRRRSLIASR